RGTRRTERASEAREAPRNGEGDTKKSCGLFREGERVRFALVDAEKAHYPVETLCDVLGVSRSGFYAWKKRPSSARSKRRARLAVEIAATHKKSHRRYGSPRVHRALRKRGVLVSRKTVERVMREDG